VAGLLSYDGTPTASIPFAQKVQRECAQCRVVIAIEREIERLEVPLVGSHRTAYKRGLETTTLRITQGPLGAHGARPLPGEAMSAVLTGDPYRQRPKAMYRTINRTSFGGIELEIVLLSDDAMMEVMRRVYWCLRKDGNLRNLRLPDGHTNVLMLADVDPAAPWLGYARFAA
jgi:hypothetical protein